MRHWIAHFLGIFFVVSFVISCTKNSDATSNSASSVAKDTLPKSEVIQQLFVDMLALPESDALSEKPKEELYIDSLLTLFRKKENYNWKPETEVLQVIRSDDQKMHAISWFSPYSGTMWYIQTILQIQLKNGGLQAVSLNRLFNPPVETGTPTMMVTEIYALPNPDKQQYLLIGDGQMSGTEPYAAAHVVEVSGENITLKDEILPEQNGLFEMGNATQKPEFQYNTRTKVLHSTTSNKQYQYSNGKFLPYH